MLRYFIDLQDVDIFNPYCVLPIERIVTYLGERR
jgi:hypothetical protein